MLRLNAMKDNIKLSSFTRSNNINKKEMGHTTVSAIKASSVTLLTWQKQKKILNSANVNRTVDSKTGIN